MAFIYLTTNANRSEPESLAGVDYIHVKCKSDGSRTLVITPQLIDAADCEALSPDAAQALLDGWIDEENAGLVPDEQNNLMTQSRIDLGSFIS